MPRGAARRGGTRQNRQKRGRPLLSQLKSYTHRGASRFLCILHMYIPIPYQYKLHIFIGIRNDCVPMRQRLKLTVPEQPACLLASPRRPAALYPLRTHTMFVRVLGAKRGRRTEGISDGGLKRVRGKEGCGCGGERGGLSTYRPKREREAPVSNIHTQQMNGMALEWIGSRHGGMRHGISLLGMERGKRQQQKQRTKKNAFTHTERARERAKMRENRVCISTYTTYILCIKVWLCMVFCYTFRYFFFFFCT